MNDSRKKEVDNAIANLRKVSSEICTTRMAEGKDDQSCNNGRDGINGVIADLQQAENLIAQAVRRLELAKERES